MRRDTIGLLSLALVGLCCQRRAEPLTTAPDAAASPPPPAPLPATAQFESRLPTPNAPSRVVLAEPAKEIAVAGTTLYALVATPPPNDKHRLIASNLTGGARRVLTELGADGADLTVIGPHVFWTEQAGERPWLRRVVRANLDGTDVKEILPSGAHGSSFCPAGNGEYVLLHDDTLYVFDAGGPPRVLVKGSVPDAGDPERDALGRLQESAIFGGDGDRVYWSTGLDPTKQAKLYSIARMGRPIRIEEPLPSKLLGVTSAGVYVLAGGAITRRKDGKRTTITGDARGRVDAMRVVAGDAYVRLLRVVSQGEFQRVVVKLGKDAAATEPLVDAWSFDVTADKLYFATDKDVRVMPR